MIINGLGKIYIIHYVKLSERRAYLEKRLKELGLEKYSKWIVSEKDGSFDKKQWKLHDDSEKGLQDRKRVLQRDFPPIGKIDTIMMLQHMQILGKIAKQKGSKISIVLEDDAILDDDFPANLEAAVKKLNSVKWDICYSDKGSALVEPKTSKKEGERVALYEPADRGANTTGSYMIKPESAKKLLSLMKKIVLGPDLELSYVQKKNNLKVYWTVPFLTHQGSIESVYQSNVRKGTLFEIFVMIIKRADRISPSLGRFAARVADRFMKVLYKSKILMFIKNRIKSLVGYT